MGTKGDWQRKRQISYDEYSDNWSNVFMDKMSKVTRVSKAHPSIRICSDATDNAPKPYLGYHRGGGMPGAREPVTELSAEARKTFDKIFGFEEDDFIQNAESQEKRRKRNEQRTKKTARKRPAKSR